MKTWIWILVIAAAIIGIYLYRKGALTRLGLGTSGAASCIKNSGAKFYGTTWCGFCNEQKEMFGSDKDNLPYIECSGPNGKGLAKVCADAGVTSFPTWKFADGTQEIGALSVEKLKNKTGC